MMGKFYFKMESTNGNYYLADILEIALIAEDSGYVFHMYVQIHYSVPRRVRQLTGITNITVQIWNPNRVYVRGQHAKSSGR